MDDFAELGAAVPAKPDNIEAFKADVASGVEKMRTLAYGDLEEIRQALDEGDIQAAMKSHQELSAKLGSLGYAEHQFAALGAGNIVPVVNLQEGMWVRDLGRVQSVGEPYDQPCQSGRHSHRYVEVNFDDGDDEPSHIPADARLVVIAQPDEEQKPA